jgi:hypothetical protein
MIAAVGVLLVIAVLLRPVLRFFPPQVSHVTYMVIATAVGLLLHDRLGYSVGQCVVAIAALVVATVVSGRRSSSRARVRQPPAPFALLMPGRGTGQAHRDDWH